MLFMLVYKEIRYYHFLYAGLFTQWYNTSFWMFKLLWKCCW